MYPCALRFAHRSIGPPQHGHCLAAWQKVNSSDRTIEVALPRPKTNPRVAVRDLPADVATITFDNVLMVGQATKKDGGAKIGTPYVKGAKVTAEVLGRDRTDKVEIVKFKRRKTYLRRKGHRQDYLEVKITSSQG